MIVGCTFAGIVGCVPAGGPHLLLHHDDGDDEDDDGDDDDDDGDDDDNDDDNSNNDTDDDADDDDRVCIMEGCSISGIVDVCLIITSSVAASR